MISGRFHLVDIAVVVAYLVAVIFIGKCAAAAVDAVGFLACCAFSGAIARLFVLLLRLAP